MSSSLVAILVFTWPKASCSLLNIILFEHVRVFDRVKLVTKSSKTHPFTLYNQPKYEFHQLSDIVCREITNPITLCCAAQSPADEN